ncbi:glucosamine-6-phosphate deaminase [Candidatus Poribacteria bacterium]|nr:glucosamine-6-phosphate deaminase [Candidatus Poribacteria bacterium]
MELIIADNRKDLGRKGAEFILDEMKKASPFILGLAAGNTPVPVYEELVKKYEAGEADFSHVETFNVDEFAGMRTSDERSFATQLRQQFLDRVNIPFARRNTLESSSGSPRSACEQYEAKIRAAGGIHLQILGIGKNAHIGFNEPSNAFSRRTQRVRLDERTRKASRSLFPALSDVPGYGITMGVGTIMRARAILLLANGPDKINPLKRAFLGPVNPRVPASILQFHPNLTVVVTKEAARFASASYGGKRWQH